MKALRPALVALAVLAVACGRGEDRPTMLALPEQGGGGVVASLADPSAADGSAGSAALIAVEMGDRGCELRPSKARPGQLSLLVTNTGSTPARLLLLPASGASDQDALAELPPLPPLESTQFGLRLGPGRYQVRCDPVGPDGAAIASGPSVALSVS